MRVFFLPAAAAEYWRQIDYYESKRIGLGARYLDEIKAALESIATFPEQFPLVKPPSLRKIVLKRFPFTILFRLVGEDAQVVAIAAHRRAPDYWTERV